MHVSLISEHASPLAALGGVDAGGQNVYVAQTATLLARRGHTVDVYTRRTDAGQPEAIMMRPGLRVVHVDAGPPRHVPKEELLPFMPGFAESVIARMSREGRPDIVHAHFWMSGMVAAEVKRRLGVPFVITFHALGKVRRAHQGDDDHFPEDRFTAEKDVIDAADRIIAECPQDAADLEQLYGAAPSSLVQVPCGFDPQELEPVDRGLARELLGVPQDADVVLQLGRMVPRKGVDDAVCGFARATRGRADGSQRAREAVMLVVGGEAPDESVVDTPEGRRLQAIAAEEGAADRIRFLGSRSRETLKYVYSAADVFVSVPWYEPFGITPLEAMACGVPVVGSSVGGIKHTVADGLTGLLVPAHDPDAVALALVRLLDNGALRARMGRAARRRVNEQFTWQTVTEALEAVYFEVAAPSTTLELQGPARLGSLAQTAHELVALARAVEPHAEKAARLVSEAAMGGRKVLACGNGGSAADAQHLAAELVGRFQMERGALPALALTTDTSLLTAIGNDYGFDEIFARQVSAHAERGDVLVAISTSGDSANVVEALKTARAAGVRTVGLLGRSGGEAKALCDVAVVVPSDVTARIQEVHQLVIHRFAEAAEAAYTGAIAASQQPRRPVPIEQRYLA